MYQREAMWMSFKSMKGRNAVKISVGGINALTGHPQNSPAPARKQGYIVVDQGDDDDLQVQIALA